MGGISKEQILNSLNQETLIEEEEIYNAIMNRNTIVHDINRDFSISDGPILSSKHRSRLIQEFSLLDETDNPIRIIYNKGKDNDQMLLTKIKQACAKKGYHINNANRLIHQLKREGSLEI